MLFIANQKVQEIDTETPLKYGTYKMNNKCNVFFLTMKIINTSNLLIKWIWNFSASLVTSMQTMSIWTKDLTNGKIHWNKYAYISTTFWLFSMLSQCTELSSWDFFSNDGCLVIILNTANGWLSSRSPGSNQNVESSLSSKPRNNSTPLSNVILDIGFAPEICKTKNNIVWSLYKIIT